MSGVLLKVTVTEGDYVKGIAQLPVDSVGVINAYRISPPEAGTYVVLVEAADTALHVPSVSFNVTVRGKRLVFTQQPPSTITSGQTVTIQVAIQDHTGATITTGTPSNINLAIDPSGASGWSIGGTGSVTPVNGVATFNVQITTTSGAKTGVRIQAVGAGLPAKVSAKFNINP